MKKGFTLLELLVVIAIIGILSSIILVSYNGYTAKARIAKTLQWAGSINHSLGDRAVGAWTFDNISTSSNTVYDDSGNNNNGTVYGSPVMVDGVAGKAMQFDGVDDYVDVGDISTQNWANLTTEAWVYWTANGVNGYAGVYYKDSGGDLGRLLIANSGQLLVQNGNSNFNSNGANDVLKNNWTHIAYTHNQSAGQEYLYVNGVLKGQKARTGNIIQNATNLWIGFGYNLANNYMFPGYIDDVRIYSAALTQAQIQQHYVDGLKTHQPLAKIIR